MNSKHQNVNNYEHIYGKEPRILNNQNVFGGRFRRERRPVEEQSENAEALPQSESTTNNSLALRDVQP
ncbi:hypothetical protein GWI33_007162 [Rhynchophorus ferrugineus]|uniref:Uncharacterized protein n=1 Tax=Rhynchophorus ferrugineus TaxID=354439 RepID=A0A834ISD4_RHYFE|nr:hypothetical protein GWI33_007162 [Rhynchophorus ferrugineus]